MSEHIEETKHDISIEGVIYDDGKPEAHIQTYTHPSGHVTNNLSPVELREVADMLNDVADELEGKADD